MSMDCMSTPPKICISFALPEESIVEPYSPFSSAVASPVDNDAFRLVHLIPPPTLTKGVKPLSPLRPSDNDIASAPEGERFSALIQAAKERRNLVMDSTKAYDLRKEITLKAHKYKQVQRRALFFSKVLASRSFNSTLTPTTLPESLANFPNSLPSPERVSPLAFFESLSEDAKYRHEPRAEPVDLQTFQHTKVKGTSSHIRRPPSLDQISTHITYRTARSSANKITDLTLCPVVVSHRPRLQAGVGRLQMPLRDVTQSTEILSSEPHGTLELSVKATISPATQSNPFTLSSRKRNAHNMLSTLGRRTNVSERRLDGTEPETVVNWKRHSAPGDLLPQRGRSEFKHPVLTLPGGF